MTPQMTTPAAETVVHEVLDRWKDAVDHHDPQRVASVFTEDAVFQGTHPYTVGRAGVVEYYDSQPLGMTAHYQVLQTRNLAADLILGFLDVDFAYTDRPTLSVKLGVLLRRGADGWSIAHYQVSQQVSQLEAGSA